MESRTFKDFFESSKEKISNSISKATEKAVVDLKEVKQKCHLQLKKIEKGMIGPIEKGIEAAKLQSPPKGVYENIDLTILPKYVSYKAALIKEKYNLQFFLILICIVHVGYILATKIEVSNLVTKLREKEYILAPGVSDFTPASAQSVPDQYINDAVTDFLLNLGNINSSNIDEQYSSLKRFMSDKLKVRFELELSDWIEQVKSDEISQILTINEKEIITNDDGSYKITAFARAEFYSNSNYLGHEDQVIQMDLSLTSPKAGKRWYLEISELTVSKAESFNSRKKLSQ